MGPFPSRAVALGIAIAPAVVDTRESMNPITHALAAWCLAETAPSLGNRERGIVVLAGIAPDVDGLGIVPEMLTQNGPHPLLWWSEYHHLLAHDLAFACVAAAVAALCSRVSRGVTALLAFLAVHLHLLGDLAGSRGPDGYPWPIPYSYPFSRSPELTWSHQWKLNAWPNVVLTLVLLILSFVLAWERGYSPLVLISSRIDRTFVGALRGRLPRRVVASVDR